MNDPEPIDYFMDLSLVDNPYPYFETLRAEGPVTRLPHRGVVAVTGHEEALKVYNDPETFSSANAVSGPLPPLPFTPEGDDIFEQLEANRKSMPASTTIVTLDQPAHGRARSLLMRLFTPSRMKANEEYLWGLADRLIDEFQSSGKVEIVHGYGVPFAGLVIADLLGVPDEDRPWFKDNLGGLPQVGDEVQDQMQHPLMKIGIKFATYIMERYQNPRDDVLGDLASAKYPDGSTPTLEEVVTVATFLFGAGQDTTARLLSAAMQILAENPDIQARVRADRSLIPDFIEEVLRFEGPVKTSSRLVRKTTTLAGIELKAGTCVSLLNGAINRDPRKFDNPQAFVLGRPKVREHVAFGRGAHTCIGAMLARTEVRVSLERLLDRMGDIRISDAHHGPPDARTLHHEPTYILRGLQKLHLEFTPIGEGR